MTPALERTSAGLSRVRALGIPSDGTPGVCNAITEAPGVHVGHTTLISGDGPLTITSTHP